jgi:hypothetical protein
VTLNLFNVRPTCDTADVQVMLPFPPNLSRMSCVTFPVAVLMCCRSSGSVFGSGWTQTLSLTKPHRKKSQNCYIAQIPGHQLRSIGAAAISFQHWFTLFSRDGSSDYRTILNVTFTVCNLHEFIYISLHQFQIPFDTSCTYDNLFYQHHLNIS